MLKRRTLPILFIALAMGGLAAWWAGKWAQARLTPSPEAIGKPVVVAVVQIAFGKKIDPADVVVKRMPAEFIPAGAFASMEELEKKVAIGPIYPGEVVIREKVAGYEGGSPLSAIVGVNKRAVTVRVNDVIGVAGFLLPGNYVDVVGSHKKGQEAQAKTILQNMKVLAVDQTSSTNKDDPVIVRAVTLEMTQEEAEKLVKATNNGNVQLTLRNPLDTEVVAERIPEPKPRPRPRPKAKSEPPKPTVPQVTVIKGSKVSTTAVGM